MRKQKQYRPGSTKLTLVQKPEPALAPAMPLLAWPLPASKENAPEPHRKSSKKRSGKRRFPGLQLVIAQWQIDRMEACARCMGIEPRTFLYYTVTSAISKVEEMFGAGIHDLTRMSKLQRADLASKFRKLLFTDGGRSGVN